jgi:hypothetical protein
MGAANVAAPATTPDEGFMASLIKSSFVWQFVAGFALGALGLAAAHAAPPTAQPAPTHISQ